MTTMLRTLACALLAAGFAACGGVSDVPPEERVEPVEGAVYAAPDPPASIDTIRGRFDVTVDASLPADAAEELFEIARRFDVGQEERHVLSIGGQGDDRIQVDVVVGSRNDPCLAGYHFEFERGPQGGWVLVKGGIWIT